MFESLSRLISEPPPDFLFEVTSAGLAAASPRRPDKPVQEIMPPGALAPSPSAPNMLRPQLYREALPRVAGAKTSRSKTAALVIPDYAVRMAILDFESFPAKEEERSSLLQFRLRKSVPFHIEDAQLSYSVQRNEPARVEVLAVAIARPILEEYESLFSEHGFRVGLVTPSSVAALRLVAPAETGTTLFAKLAGATLTIILLQQRSIRLIRCLDLATAGFESERWETGQIMDSVQQTLAFAEDQLEEPVSRLLFCGFGFDTDPLGTLAQQEFGLPYAVTRSKFGIASQESAGLMGLLEEYIA